MEFLCSSCLKIIAQLSVKAMLKVQIADVPGDH